MSNEESKPRHRKRKIAAVLAIGIAVGIGGTMAVNAIGALIVHQGTDGQSVQIGMSTAGSSAACQGSTPITVAIGDSSPTWNSTTFVAAPPALTVSGFEPACVGADVQVVVEDTGNRGHEEAFSATLADESVTFPFTNPDVIYRIDGTGPSGVEVNVALTTGG